MKDKFKNFFSKENVDIQNLRNKLINSQSMARKYLEIVKNFEKNKEISDDDYNYIVSNSGILQLKMMKLKPQLGVIYYRRPFNLGVFPNYEVVSNFPTLLSDPRLKKEAFKFITIIVGTLSLYITMIDDIIEDSKKLKSLLNRGKKSKKKWKIIKEDKKSLYNIFLIPIYIISLTLLFSPVTFTYGIILNIVSVFLIVLVSFLSKSD
ncbi:MAG: hypothetical protein V3V33_00565 [Candidatus Lokiarchaeia archaeon]